MSELNLLWWPGWLDRISTRMSELVLSYLTPKKKEKLCGKVEKKFAGFISSLKRKKNQWNKVIKKKQLNFISSTKRQKKTPKYIKLDTSINNNSDYKYVKIN